MNTVLKHELIAYDFDNSMKETKVECYSNQKISDLKNNLGIILASTEKYSIDNNKDDIEVYFGGRRLDEDEKLKENILYANCFCFKRVKQKHKYIYIKYLDVSKFIAYNVNEDDTIYNLLTKASKDILKDPKDLKFIFAGKQIDPTIKFKDCDFFTSSDSPYGAILTI
jgi:hypothetical protein